MIYTGIAQNKDHISPVGAVLALGCFDGFHRGHQALIRRAKEEADICGAPLAVWTPVGIKKPGGRLFPREYALSFMEALGVSVFLEEEFEGIRNLDGKTFFEGYILKIYRPAALVCGENFRFGKAAGCGTKELRSFCEEARLKLIVCPAVRNEKGEIVSSTGIKNALANGQPEVAADLLGRPYSLTATVQKGRQVGRDLGFPTLNLPLHEGQPLKFGVYFAKVSTSQGCFPAAVNVGIHPTFKDDAAPVCEAHLLTTPSRLIEYGEECTVSFLTFKRSEKAFSSPDELKKTVFEDLKSAKAYFGL